MSVQDAIDRACADVGIRPPHDPMPGKWLRTDTLARNGKRDAQIIVNEHHVTAINFQTGETVTVATNERQFDIRDRRKIAREIEIQKEKKAAQANRAAKTAQRIVDAATLRTHPYLSGKGFPEERALVIDAGDVRKIAGDYLVPDNCKGAIVMPARIDARITSVQIIAEDGSKKFLSGGTVNGASHRIATGKALWLCEGFATGLSLRQALKALRINATVLCCFSASNVAAVARTIPGRCIIVADNDKPLEQFGGVGTGEHYARQTGKAFFMPPEVGTDLNDHHCKHGIFSVQRLITDFIREQRRAA